MLEEKMNSGRGPFSVLLSFHFIFWLSFFFSSFSLISNTTGRLRTRRVFRLKKGPRGMRGESPTKDQMVLHGDFQPQRRDATSEKAGLKKDNPRGGKGNTSIQKEKKKKEVLTVGI